MNQQEKQEPPELSLTDSEIIERASKAKNGDKFRSLFSGEWRSWSYPSQSEADLALANLLCWWCGGNRGMMERLFRSSGMYRNEHKMNNAIRVACQSATAYFRGR